MRGALVGRSRNGASVRPLLLLLSVRLAGDMLRWNLELRWVADDALRNDGDA